MSGAVLKLVGMIAVFLSAWLASRSLSGRERAAVAQIEGYIALFRVIRSGILYYRAPLADILTRCDADVLFACSGRGEVLRCDSLLTMAEGSFFDDKTLESIVHRAASELGRSLGESESTLCDRYIEELTELCRMRSVRAREQTRLVGTLLFAGAAGIVILWM